MQDPNRLTDEIRRSLDFFATKGADRINRRFWDNWDYYAALAYDQ